MPETEIKELKIAVREQRPGDVFVRHIGTFTGQVIVRREVPVPPKYKEGMFGWATVGGDERHRGFIEFKHGALGLSFYGGWSSDISDFVEDPFTEKDVKDFNGIL